MYRDESGLTIGLLIEMPQVQCSTGVVVSLKKELYIEINIFKCVYIATNVSYYAHIITPGLELNIPVR